MRIALIGDIHAYSLNVRARRLLSRRILAQSNLWINRRFRFNHALLAPLMDQVRAVEPDLVLCSGDITTTSLEDEFTDVMNHFRPLAEQTPVVVVPGNHDRYTFKSRRKRRMEEMLEGLMPHEFPHHRQLSPKWRLIALDSGIPNVLTSRGALGEAQFAALSRSLHDTPADQGVVLLCHYPAATPPGMPNSWAHNLREAAALRRMLTDCPQPILFMHGHVHQPWYWASGEGQTNGHAPALAYLNAGSPCMTSNKYPMGQGFWQIDLPDDPAQQISLLHQVPQSTTYGPNRMKRVTAVRHAGAAVRWEPRRVL